MAVLEDVPGVKVTVCINGVDRPEYEDPDAEDAQGDVFISSKFIESVDDAEFEIRFWVDSKYDFRNDDHCLAIHTTVDGEFVQCPIVSHCRPFPFTIFGPYDKPAGPGACFVRKLKFTAIKTTDDNRRDRIETDKNLMKDVGLIEVAVRRVVITGSNTREVFKANEIASSLEVTEKSLKGKDLSHGTRLATAAPILEPRWVNTSIIAEDGGNPIAIFRFYYRSKDSLKRTMVIPRTPPRSPTPPVQFQDLSEAERDQMARDRFEELQRQSRVKTEVGVKPESARKRDSNEVYDLTGDDEQPTKRPRGDPTIIDLTDD